MYVHLNTHARYIFFKGCVKDAFMGSLGLKRNCRMQYSCAKLTGRLQENCKEKCVQEKCNKKFKEAMSIGCKNQMSKYRQNLVIKKKCKKSCNNCKSKFFV